MDVPLKRSKVQKEFFDNDKVTYSLRSYLRFGHIHGLKYLGRKEKCETFFWLLVLVMSTFLAAFLIIILNGSQSDLLIRADLPARPIHFLPFPAITICPETKAQKDVVDFTEAYHKYQLNQSDISYTDEEVAQIEAMSQVCDPHLMIDKTLKSVPTSGKDFADILRKISVSDFILFCKFRGKVESCSKYFKEVITEDGICYTFNMLDARDLLKSSVDEGISKPSWTFRSGYLSQDFDTFPHRALSGADIGFNVVLNLKSTDLDFICRGPVQGYKFKIHSPDEHPRMSHGYQRIPLNSETLVQVKPKVSIVNYQFGSMCHSSATKSLQYFKEYSQSNCMSECLSNFVLSQCKCVKFSMVHDNDTEICNQHHSKCISDAVLNFETIFTFDNDFPCDCKPSCESLSFDTKVTGADFNFKQIFQAYRENLTDEFPASIMSRLVVYLEDNSYVQSTYKTLEDTPFTFIAKVGGILAFFLGASWISIIEVAFYIVRRLTC